MATHPLYREVGGNIAAFNRTYPITEVLARFQTDMLQYYAGTGNQVNGNFPQNYINEINNLRNVDPQEQANANALVTGIANRVNFNQIPNNRDGRILALGQEIVNAQTTINAIDTGGTRPSIINLNRLGIGFNPLNPNPIPAVNQNHPHAGLANQFIQAWNNSAQLSSDLRIMNAMIPGIRQDITRAQARQQRQQQAQQNRFFIQLPPGGLGNQGQQNQQTPAVPPGLGPNARQQNRQGPPPPGLGPNAGQQNGQVPPPPGLGPNAGQQNRQGPPPPGLRPNAGQQNRQGPPPPGLGPNAGQQNQQAAQQNPNIGNLAVVPNPNVGGVRNQNPNRRRQNQNRQNPRRRTG